MNSMEQIKMAWMPSLSVWQTLTFVWRIPLPPGNTGASPITSQSPMTWKSCWALSKKKRLRWDTGSFWNVQQQLKGKDNVWDAWSGMKNITGFNGKGNQRNGSLLTDNKLKIFFSTFSTGCYSEYTFPDSSHTDLTSFVEPQLPCLTSTLPSCTLKLSNVFCVWPYILDVWS